MKKKSNNYLVSVVTVSYNQGAFLEMTIKSVLNQNYNKIEYIIIDGGSTDNSREIIMKYKDNISKIIFEKDDGPSDALAKGMSIASGEILYFLNADDILLQNSIKKVINTFKRDKNIDVVYGNTWEIDRSGNRIRKHYSDYFFLNLALYNSSILMQQSVFFKRSAYIKAGGFNKNNKISWDHELFVNLKFQKCKFIKINDILSEYRFHDSSWTKKKLNKQLISNEMKKIFFKIKKKKFRNYQIIFFYFYRLIQKIINFQNVIEKIKVIFRRYIA